MKKQTLFLVLALFVMSNLHSSQKGPTIKGGNIRNGAQYTIYYENGTTETCTCEHGAYSSNTTEAIKPFSPDPKKFEPITSRPTSIHGGSQKRAKSRFQAVRHLYQQQEEQKTANKK